MQSLEVIEKNLANPYLIIFEGFFRDSEGYWNMKYTYPNQEDSSNSLVIPVASNQYDQINKIVEALSTKTPTQAITKELLLKVSTVDKKTKSKDPVLVITPTDSLTVKNNAIAAIVKYLLSLLK
jgi:hypothetical protein